VGVTTRSVRPFARVSAASLVRSARESGRSFLLTFVAVVLLAFFLSPLLRSATVAFKTTEQATRAGAPAWPASPATFEFEGREYEVYQVPTAEGMRELALVRKGREQSEFVDPSNPTAGTITWQGSWRSLDPAWKFDPTFKNFEDAWTLIDYPRLLFNTVAIAILGTIGTLISCVLVAYGFARFRFPGRGLLFTLLIATIFLPAAVTLVPTYTVFVKMGWVGTWLPLIVPAFFANPYDVFLLRQYFLTIPRDLDEAATIDGAGPFRTLLSVVLPQAWPAVIAVTIFHLVYSWNDFFAPLIYLSTVPELQPISVGLARFNGIYYTNPGAIQAGTLMALAVPVIVFLLTQRVFTRGVVITGVEK
jgi:multiple sugar transport system permease protein